MTLLYNSNSNSEPSTHVLAIGVGKYPHLLNGDKKLAGETLGLKQLRSPPVSVKTIIDWFLSTTISATNIGFTNSRAPLGTIHALASAEEPVVIQTPNGLTQLPSATKSNIDDAFGCWLEALKKNDDNIGVFYFCGHGLMVSDHYLLAEDFGKGHQPWSNAFDVSSTIRAVEREVNGTLYFFLDACRSVSRELALSAGANPHALMPADLRKEVSRKSTVCISATGEGELAFAPVGGKTSHFTSALIHAMSGFAGTKTSGKLTWEIDGETLASAIRKILEYNWVKNRLQQQSLQICEQMINGRSVPLIRLPYKPKVTVQVNYLPEQMRSSYKLYIESTRKIIASQIKENQLFEAIVPMGIYTIGAVDPDGSLQPDIRPDEDLRPPCYQLELGE